jgi:hypothetical protein
MITWTVRILDEHSSTIRPMFPIRILPEIPSVIGKMTSFPWEAAASDEKSARKSLALQPRWVGCPSRALKKQ